MIGWIIFAVVVAVMAGWGVVGFFRRRKIQKAKREGEREIDRAYEAYYSDPDTIRSHQQIHEEFKLLMRW